MEPEEILAFKLFDSDRSRVQWTGHTAFDDPNAPADAPRARASKSGPSHSYDAHRSQPLDPDGLVTFKGCPPLWSATT